MTREEQKQIEAAIKAEKIETLKRILREVGIEMQVNGCGCCGSPYVHFEFNGDEVISDDDVIFDTRKE